MRIGFKGYFPSALSEISGEPEHKITRCKSRDNTRVLIDHLHTSITRKLAEISESKEHSVNVNLSSGHWKIQPHTQTQIVLMSETDSCSNCTISITSTVMNALLMGEKNNTTVWDFLVRGGKKTKGSTSTILTHRNRTTGHKDMEKS